MQLDIITPEKIFYSADAQMVVIPGVEGDFGVLDGHAPVISAIRPGIITIDAEGKQRRLAVAGGFAEVVPERVSVLAESAIDVEGITAADVQSRIDAAKFDLETADSDTKRLDAQKRLAVAEVIAQAI